MRRFHCVFLAVGIIFFDQLLKILAVSLKEPGFFIFYDFIGFTLHRNTGMAFGISWIRPSVIIFVTVILLSVFLFFLRASFKKGYVALTFFQTSIIAGGISNLLDRLVRHEVIDYISLLKYSHFNMADAAIVIGVFGWILLSRKKDGTLTS